MTTYQAQTELLLFHGDISSVFELVLIVRATIFRADLGSEAAMCGGAPYVLLQKILAVTLGGVSKSLSTMVFILCLGGKPGFLLQAVELDKLPRNLVNTGRLILNIVILAPEQRDFQ